MAKVEEYQQMMAWLTRPKSKFQEPRSMDLAALSDDVVPGSLKDELEGKPPQEAKKALKADEAKQLKELLKQYGGD